MTPEKYAVIRGYLSDAFPGRVIEEAEDHDRVTWHFRVLLNARSLLAAFSQEVIDDLNAEEIKTTIEKCRIVDLVRDHWTSEFSLPLQGRY